MKQNEIKQFQSQFGIVRYLDFEGEGIPVLFVHGLGCCGMIDYPPVVSGTNLSGHRKIIIDLLGSGTSDKPENFEYSIMNQTKILKEFIDYLKVDKVILYGHSMGGAIAINLAVEIKEKLHSIILSEANLDNGGGFFSKQIANYSFIEFRDVGYQKIIEENYANGNAIWAKSLSNTSPKAVYDEAVSLVEGQPKTWRSILYELPCPRTFIFGEKSLPDRDLEDLQQNKINIEIVKNAGHSMAWENPEGLAKAIAEGLKYSMKKE